MKSLMRVFDFYLFRNLLVAALFITVILAVVIVLTQSLKFLELVINSGASTGAFWILTMLALPRFFEVIVPLALMAGTLFVYNKLIMDSELVVIRSVGYSPMALARPALILAAVVTVFLWITTMWAAPASLTQLQKMRQMIKAQFSTLIFRDGVFNAVGSGLTVYIRENTDSGELRGIMIHDRRENERMPSTVLAQRGVVISNDQGYQVLVYDGSRQEFDPETKSLRRLNFKRYTIDLPDSDTVRERWQEPDERTLWQLMNPNPQNARDAENAREFRVEIHKRIAGPLLAATYTIVALCSLLLGPISRQGYWRRIAVTIICVMIIQGFSLAAANIARHSNLGLVMMYILILLPIFAGLFLLSGHGDKVRRRLLYGQGGRK